MWIKKAEMKGKNIKNLYNLCERFTSKLDSMYNELDKSVLMTENDLEDKDYNRLYDKFEPYTEKLDKLADQFQELVYWLEEKQGIEKF